MRMRMIESFPGEGRGPGVREHDLDEQKAPVGASWTPVFAGEPLVSAPRRLASLPTSQAARRSARQGARDLTDRPPPPSPPERPAYLRRGAATSRRGC